MGLRYFGQDNETGKKISEFESVKQSIADVIKTPLGSRVMLRDYGSRVFDLLDAPIGDNLDYYIAIEEALTRWEPRFKLDRVSITPDSDGRVDVRVFGRYMPTGGDLEVVVGL